MSEAILARPASRQARNFSKSSASLNGRSACPLARRTCSLLMLPPATRSTRTWSQTEAPRDLGIVVLVGFDADPTHQILNFRTPDEAVGVLGEAGTPRDHRRRHRELHAELRLEAGLRPVVAQDQRVGVAQ